MLTLFIVLFLFNAAYNGARRGLVLQVVYTVGYFLAYLVARLFYQDLAPHLELLIPYPSASEGSHFSFFNDALGLDLDKSFYAGVAFVIILLGAGLVVRFIGRALNYLTFLPLIKQFNHLGGGILSFILTYVGILIVLYVLAMVPVPVIQNTLANSSLASFMINDTPIISKQLYKWWVTSMI